MVEGVVDVMVGRPGRDGQVFFVFAPASCARELLLAGWRFRSGRWWTRSPVVAARMSGVLPFSSAAQDAVAAAEEAFVASMATDADVVLPVPPGVELRPYQRAGVAYALRAKERGYCGCLIADEMGLGKTAQAIVFANAVAAQRVLVVCPSAVVINWCREIAAWATNGRCKILSKAKPNTPTPEDGWNVVNYDKLGLSGFDGIHNTEWDLVIFDESHYIKNHKAKRTKAALNISASFRLFLTGTPVLNRPVELWTTVNACAPGLFAHRQAYVVKFCDAHMGRWGWDESGASNLDELQTTLRSTIMVRRHKAAVLDDLPPKTRQVLPLEGDGAAVKKAKRLWSQAVDTFGLEHAAERLSGQPVGFESFSEVRRAVGLAKVPAVVQHVLEVVESDAKVLVFAHHKDVAKAIYDGLTTGGVQAVLATGETAVEGRQKAVDAFQTDGRIKVFVGTIGAVGAGITLTKASVVVFAELPLVPGLVEQAEDRAHRIGQRGAVLVQYLVYDGTIDAHVARILVKKEKVIRSAC